MSGGVYYPPSPQNGSNQPANFPYDVVIQENFPGVVYLPQEPGGVYAAMREVNGCLWFVNNADWNPNTSQWEQNSGTNANNAAYALELCADGTFARYASPATDVPGTAITWTKLFNIDANGYVLSTPKVVTAAGAGQNQLTVTWNLGTSTQAEARRIVVTDTSSAASSLLDNLVVNGSSKWAVDKTGTLVAGQIPFARITGFSPVFNNATFTGTTTFNGPVVTNNGITNTGGITTDSLTASGTITANSFVQSGGGFFSDAPATTTANATLVAPGSSITLTIHSSHGYAPGTTILVFGTGTNATESFTGIVTAINSQPATSLTITVISILAGTNGDILNAGAVVGFSTVNQTLTSTDGNLAITQSGTAIHPALSLAFTNPYPAPTTASYTIPPIGSNCTVVYRFADGFPEASYIWVNGPGGTSQMLGKILGNSVTGGITTSTVQCLEVPLGTVGQTIGAGALVFNASYDPNLFSQGIVLANLLRPNPTSYPFSQSISLPTLPGTATDNYKVYCSMTFDTAGGGTQSLTGAGAAWEAPITEPDFGGAQPIDLFGTAVGGNAPSVTWSAVGGIGATGYIGVLQIYAYPS